VKTQAVQQHQQARAAQLGVGDNLNKPKLIPMDVRHKMYPSSYVPTGNEHIVHGRVVTAQEPRLQQQQQRQAAKPSDIQNKPKYIHMDVSHKIYPSSYVPTGNEPIVYGRVVDPPKT